MIKNKIKKKKPLSKVGREGTYLNILYEKLTTNIIFNSEKLDMFPLRSGKRQEYLLHYFHST